MGIFSNVIENALGRTEIILDNISITIGLEQGAIKIKGQIPAIVVDSEKPANPKVLASFEIPVDAKIAVKEVTFPVPTVG